MGATRKEVYCEICGSYQPVVEREPHDRSLAQFPWHPYPCYDLTCGTCFYIVASLRIVPNDAPIDSSKAIEFKPYRVK